MAIEQPMLSIFVADAGSVDEGELVATVSALNDAEFRIEVLVAYRTSEIIDFLEELRRINRRGVSIRIFQFTENPTCGDVFASMFLSARGTYCIFFSRSLSGEIISCVPLVAALRDAPHALYATFDSFPGAASGSSLELQPTSTVSEIDLNFDRSPTRNNQSSVVWRRTAYLLLGGVGSGLHLCADLDFEKRMEKNFRGRGLLVKPAGQPLVTGRVKKGETNSVMTGLGDAAPDAARQVQPPISYNNTFFFCLTHKVPLYGLPSFVNVINVSKNPDFGDYHALGFLRDHLTCEELLLGELGVFVASRLLGSLPPNKIQDHYVALCYFRKFFSTFPCGPLVANGEPIRVVCSDDVDFVAVADGVAGHLVGPTVTKLLGRTMAECYANSHCIEDYLFATSLAVDLGVLEAGERAEFLRSREFVHWAHAGCSLPVSFFIEHVEKLLKTYGAIVASGYRSPLRAVPYQRRWVAFFFERLSSFLLMKHFSNWRGPRGIIHNVNTRVEGLECFRPGGLS